jgi:hypothetical protein
MEHYETGPGGKLCRTTLTQTDWNILALLFGFQCPNDVKHFAYEQQAKADCRHHGIKYNAKELR